MVSFTGPTAASNSSRQGLHSYMPLLHSLGLQSVSALPWPLLERAGPFSLAHATSLHLKQACPVAGLAYAGMSQQLTTHGCCLTDPCCWFS